MERQNEVIGADMHIVRAQFANPGILVSVIRQIHDQLRRLAAHEGIGRLEPAPRGRLRQGPMHDRRVGGIQPAFQPLQPVGFLDHLGHVTLRFRHLGPGEFRRGRHFLGGPHVSPDQPAKFDGGIGLDVDLVLEVVLLRLIHHLRAGAGDIEFPAVVDAAQAALLVPAEIQRGETVRAQFIQQTDAPFRIAESHEVLAKQSHPHGRPVGLRDLAGEQRRQPISAHGFAHRRSGSDAGDDLVFFLRQHGRRSCVSGFAGRLAPRMGQRQPPHVNLTFRPFLAEAPS